MTPILRLPPKRHVLVAFSCRGAELSQACLRLLEFVNGTFLPVGPRRRHMGRILQPLGAPGELRISTAAGA